jgi:hypothetical protein
VKTPRSFHFSEEGEPPEQVYCSILDWLEDRRAAEEAMRDGYFERNGRDDLPRWTQVAGTPRRELTRPGARRTMAGRGKDGSEIRVAKHLAWRFVGPAAGSRVI